jgi:hypothetical protein
MTLNQIIIKLQKLQEMGYGSLRVYAVHSASGATDELGNAFVEKKPHKEMGPFDVEGPWIRISAGN